MIQNVYLTIGLVVFLALLDRYLTLYAFSLYKKKYSEFIEIESFELNPFGKKDVEESKLINFTHLFFVFFACLLIFISYLFEANFFFFIQGIFLTLFVYTNSRNIKFIIICKEIIKNPNLLTGKIKEKTLFSHKGVRAEMVGVAILLLFIFLMIPSYFTFGCFLGPLVLLMVNEGWKKRQG